MCRVGFGNIPKLTFEPIVVTVLVVPEHGNHSFFSGVLAVRRHDRKSDLNANLLL